MGVPGGTDGQCAAGESLAEVVVGLAVQRDFLPAAQERAEGLSAAALCFDGLIAIQHGAEGAICGAEHRVIAVGPAVCALIQVQVIGAFGAAVGIAGKAGDGAHINGRVRLGFEQIRTAHQFVHRTRTQLGHDAAQLLRDEEHEALHVFRLSGKLFAQLGVLGGNAEGAGAQMAHAHHTAAHGDQRRGGKAEFLRAQQQGDGHVMAAHQLAVGFQGHTLAQTVAAEYLMGLGQTDFPGQARVMHAAHGRGARAALAAGDQYALGARLCDAAGDGAHAAGGYQLYGHAGVFIGALQIIDQLRQILDGVNIVVRRRRNQRDPLRGAAGTGDFLGNLAPRQMSALAGLCALRHLDLNFFCGLQVIPGHAEATGGHLLDGRIELGAVALGKLAALAAVGFAAEVVHGLRHALVCLLGDGAIGHGAGLEALDNAFGALHLIELDALAAIVAEIQQRTNGAGTIIFHHLGVAVEQSGIVVPYSLLKGVNDLGAVEVLLRVVALAQTMTTDAVQRFAAGERIGKGLIVMPAVVCVDAAQIRAAQIAGGIGEVGVHQGSVQTDGLEQLCALVGLQRGNTHLGRDLQHTEGERLIVIGNGRLFALVNLAAPAQTGNALMRQIGVHRAHAVGNQHGHLMYIAGFATLQQHGYRGAFLFTHQMLLQRGNGQQRGYGHVRFIQTAVGQNDDVRALLIRMIAGVEQGMQRRLKALCLGIEQAQRAHVERGMAHTANALELLGRQYRRIQLDHHAVFGAGGEQVAVIADVDRLIRLHFFTDGVDGRVGHLGKALLEIGKQRRMRLGERGHGFVRAHGYDGLRAVLRHGQYHIVDILMGIAEGLAQAGALFIGHGVGGRYAAGQILQAHNAVHPLVVGLHGRKAGFDFLAAQQRARGEIGHQNAAGGQPPALDDAWRFLLQRAGLGGEDQPSVIGEGATQRTQAVPVQGCANHIAIAVKDGGRAIPGLHHGGIVAVHIPPGRVLLLALPGLGKQHHASQRQGHTVHIQKFQGVVQHLGIGTAGNNHRKYALHIIAQHGGTHGFLAGVHAVEIAAYGVDFTIVQQHPLRMGLRPAGESVGGKAGMNHRNLRCVALAVQIIVEGAQLGDQHHALVHDGAAGEGADVGIGLLFFKESAQNVELAVEFNAVRQILRTGNKALADAGHGSACACPQQLRMAGNIPPRDYAKLQRCGKIIKDAADVFHGDFIVRKKEHADGIVVGIAELNAVLPCPGGKQFVGQLGQDPYAVAGCAQCVAAGAVSEALYNRQRIAHRAVGSSSAQINHRANAAGFMLHLGIVQRIGSCHGVFLRISSIFQYQRGIFGQLHASVHRAFLQTVMCFRFGHAVPEHQIFLCAGNDLVLFPGTAGHLHMMQLNQHIYGAGHFTL